MSFKEALSGFRDRYRAAANPEFYRTQMQERENQRLVENAEPARQAMLQALTTQPDHPLAGVVNNPQAFASMMNDPKQLQTFQGMQDLINPPAPPPPKGPNALAAQNLAAAFDAEDRGDARRADIYRQRAEEAGGISGRSSEIITRLREAGIDPQSEQGQALIIRSIEGANSASVREQKIADLKARGVPEAFAQDIVDGHARMEVVPQTGQVRFTNVVTGQAYQVPLGKAGTAAQDAIAEIDETGPPVGGMDLDTEGVSLWQLAELSTGLGSTIRATAAIPLAWLGMNPFERTIQARQTALLEKRNLIRALVLNPRFPVGEMERIEEEITIAPRFWDDPKLLRSRFIAIDKSLREFMEDARRDANDPTLPQDVQAAQGANAAHISNFLGRIGLPDDARRQGTASPLPEGVPAGAVEIGTTPTGEVVYQAPDGSKWAVPR